MQSAFFGLGKHSPHSTQRRLSNLRNSAILDTVDRRMTKPKEEMFMNPYVTGQTIQMLREKRGMTQKQLAEQLYISDKTVSKWETGVSHS